MGGSVQSDPVIKANFMAISQGIQDESLLCEGACRFTPYYNNDGVNDKLEGNIIQEAIDDGRTPTELQILMSDYKYDAASNTCSGRKSLKQKAIDLYYVILEIQNYTAPINWAAYLTKDVRKELLINFTEGDLKMMNQS